MTPGGALEVRTFTAAGFGENAFLAWRRGGFEALAVDPGGDAVRMAEVVKAEGLTLEAVLLTHAHIDHVEGVAALVRATGAPVYLHEADRPWYERAAEQAAYFGVQIEAPPPVDYALTHGQMLTVAGIGLEVRHVPGHAPGHVLLYVAEAGVAFVGDVVFQGSIGRTDLPGGNYQQLMRSIREHVLSLPEATVLYPGHGPETTVAHERVSNPFLVGNYGGGLA